jgi:hypothetical protein
MHKTVILWLSGFDSLYQLADKNYVHSTGRAILVESIVFFTLDGTNIRNCLRLSSKLQIVLVFILGKHYPSYQMLLRALPHDYTHDNGKNTLTTSV